MTTSTTHSRVIIYPTATVDEPLLLTGRVAVLDNARVLERSKLTGTESLDLNDGGITIAGEAAIVNQSTISGHVAIGEYAYIDNTTVIGPAARGNGPMIHIGGWAYVIDGYIESPYDVASFVHRGSDIVYTMHRTVDGWVLRDKKREIVSASNPADLSEIFGERPRGERSFAQEAVVHALAEICEQRA